MTSIQATLSFDGVWSTPQAVDIANTAANEVFPSTSEDLDLFFHVPPITTGYNFTATAWEIAHQLQWH